nr:uncharacterized protein LOC107442797 [Parasteatoda tepidariorum]
MANNQKGNQELAEILAQTGNSSLVLQPFIIGDLGVELFCDVSTKRIRPFVPEVDRKNIFSKLHSISHPFTKATIRLVEEMFDLVFEHVHINIVGPLPPSEGFRYCLTCVDRFSKWPAAYPLADIPAKSVAETFYAGWIAGFGIPLRITTDQGTQFEASLIDALTKFLGSARHRTSPYHPAGNGQVERFHRQMKGAIRAYSKSQWTRVLPTILLGFRAAGKEDLQATTAEMVYGTPIRLPGEFLCPSTGTADPTNFVGKLKETMQELLPVKSRHRGHGAVFVSKDFLSCSHVFLRFDVLKKSLQPPYEGPFQVLSRGEKVFRILIHGPESTVNVDRLKPAYVSRDEQDIFPKSKSTAMSESTEVESTIPEPGDMPKEVKTLPGRRVKFQGKYHK